jgi:branched-subunit amino acid transport protein AzlD
MSSDVINYNSNCDSQLSRQLPTICLENFVFPCLKNNVFKNRPGTIPELMQVITDNCNLIDVSDFAKVI